jgi:sugar lactone lactonase YvrE
MRNLYSYSKSLLFVISLLFFVNASFAQTVPTPVITGNNSFCTGGSTALSTASQPGYTYCWQNTSASTTWQNAGTSGFTAGRSFFQSLAFNSNTPYVAYQDEANSSKTSVMKFNGTNWVNVGIPGFSSGYSAFQNLSFNGNTPYVAFRDWGLNLNGKCTVMKFDGTNWVNVGTPGFTGGEAGYLKFAINNGTPYVAFQDEANNYEATVMKFDGANWVNVGNPGFSAGSVNYMNLAFSGNTPYVAFADGTNSSQKTTVMKFDGTNWVNVGNPQFSTGATRNESLAIDGNTPYVAFVEDALNFKTSVMKFDGTNWVNVGNPGISAGSSSHLSLAINNNTPYVAYQDDFNGYKTTVMKFNGTSWVSVGGAGFSSGFANYQSLVFNGNTPYVAFADEPTDYKTTVMKYETGCIGTNNSIQINTPGTYTVTVTNSSGSSATSIPVTVTEGAIPTVSCPGNFEVCSNEPVFALTGGSPTGGVYSGPGVSNNQFNPATVGTGIKNITYTYTDPSTGCSNSCSFTINVKASPVVNCNVGTMYVCLNQFPFILSNVTPAGGIFSGTGVSDGRFNAAVAGVGDHTVTYTVTDPSTGCSSSCAFTVNVKPLPVVNCNVGTMYVCQNQAPFVLSNVSPAGGTFSGTGVSNGMFNPATAGVGSHTVTYTYTDQSTGCDNSCSFTVVVRPLPTVSCINGNMSVCLSQGSFALSNASPAGGTFSGTGVSNGMFNPATAGLGSHTITYTYTDQTTSCSNSCSFTITVNNSTAPVITPVSNNITLNLDASGNRIITLADIASVTGGCNSNASVRFSPTAFNCSSMGSQTVLVEATDGVFGSPNPSAVMFDQPVATAIDLAGNIYVADRSNFKIRKITPAGIVSTIADGNSNAQGPDGRFTIITDLAVDQNGNLFLTDAGSRKIKKITPAGIVTTFAGSGANSITDGTGTGASFLKLEAITIDNQGIIYVGDEHTIRKITASGIVTTIAGSTSGFADGPGTTAKFWNILGLAIAPNGNILVADASNQKVRQVTPSGMVSTVAGSGFGYTDGPIGTAQFGSLHAIAADQGGNIYVSDIDHRRIRKISTTGIVSTLAGDGTIGSNDGPGTTASFNGITGMSVDGSGNLIAAEVNGQKIRKISASGIVSTLAGNGIRGFQDGNISGITGNYISLQIPVTIKDATGPVITPVSNNIILNLGASGNRTITAADIATVTDNCNPSPTIRINPTTFNCSNIGTQNITVEATDGSFPTTPTPSNASFWDPYGIETDAAGNLYISDWGNQKIRKITPDGIVSTLAGSGSVGLINGTGAGASFRDPRGVATDAQGNVYVGDVNNHCIRKITPAGVVSIFAGSGTVGYLDGIGTNARFSSPRGLAVDAQGNVYVCDNHNARIRKITPSGVVTTIAGNGVFASVDGIGTNASIYDAVDIDIDNNGTLYIVDQSGNQIRKITPAGVVTTIAGDGTYGFINGLASSARFANPVGLTVDDAGNIYVADHNNYMIRMITPGGIVSNLASITAPTGIALGTDGNLYTTDYTNRIKKISLSGIGTLIAGDGSNGSQNGNVGGAGSGNYSSLQITITIRDITAPVITCPADVTTAVTSTLPNQTGWATATDNCSSGSALTISYTDGSDPEQGCFIVRTWKAIDASGNSATCIQRIATPGLSVSLGPNMFILYGALSYTGCRTITPVITGGIAPYTYSWTSNDPSYASSSASSLAVCHTTELSYTYTLTVTAANGCTGTASVQLSFINISCSNNSNTQKVTICHRPEGNPQNCKTICVPVSAVQVLINSGSYYGQCLPGCAIPIQARTTTGSTGIIEEPASAFDVKVLGNPSSTYFVLRITGNGNEKIRARVLDALGQLIEVKENITPGQLMQLGHNYTNGMYMFEVTQGTNTKTVKLIKQ